MKFNHVPHGLPEFKTTRVDGDIRTYIIEKDGDQNEYPSITTVLGSQDKPFLKKWVARVGHAEAERIRIQSANVGTDLHDSIEKYLQDEFNIRSVFPNIAELFLSVKPYLDKINNIRLLEGFLFSKTLQIAGTVDCIAEYDGKLSVIDFKNSRKPKKVDWIQDYVLQCTFYAMAYYELTGNKIEQIVIPIAVWSDDPQLFIFDIKKENMRKLKEIRDEFKLTRKI